MLREFLRFLHDRPRFSEPQPVLERLTPDEKQALALAPMLKVHVTISDINNRLVSTGQQELGFVERKDAIEHNALWQNSLEKFGPVVVK